MLTHLVQQMVSLQVMPLSTHSNKDGNSAYNNQPTQCGDNCTGEKYSNGEGKLQQCEEEVLETHMYTKTKTTVDQDP